MTPLSDRTVCFRCGEPLPAPNAACPACAQHDQGRPVGDVLTTQAKYVTLPINFNVAQAIVAATTGAQCLLGWALVSSAQAAGHFRLRDGTAPNSPIVAVGSFAANGESSRWFGDQGINLLNNGIWLDPQGGSIEGAVYYV